MKNRTKNNRNTHKKIIFRGELFCFYFLFLQKLWGKSTAILALTMQEAVENLLVSMFEKCNLIEIHGKRVTVQDKDVQ